MAGRFMYFLGGLGIGAAAGLLWAPKSGAETRADLRGSMEEGQTYFRQQSSAINDTIQRGREAARRTTEGMKDALEQGRAAFRNPPASRESQPT